MCRTKQVRPLGQDANGRRHLENDMMPKAHQAFQNAVVTHWPLFAVADKLAFSVHLRIRGIGKLIRAQVHWSQLSGATSSIRAVYVLAFFIHSQTRISFRQICFESRAQSSQYGNGKSC